MQTSFTENQLKDKDNRTSETIIRKCVHCGMCNATCPTYGINGEELEGPRGRIYLIKDMLENKKPATKQIAKHIDSCLSCYSCMTTCPSGVNYMHLIDHGRNYVEETYKRPFFDRLFRNILSFVLPRPKVFLLMALSSKIIKPFSFLFPKFLKNALNLMPDKIPGKKLKEKKVYEVTNGKKISRVALLTGCVQRVISPEINESTIRLLNRHNVEVVVMPDIYCCGSLNHHLGKQKLAHVSFKKNINSWHDEYLKNGLDAIISNTSGCGTTLKDYGNLMSGNSRHFETARKISELTMDISEYLNSQMALPTLAKQNMTIAYHAACSLQHGQKVLQAPRALLAQAGFEVKTPSESHLCCGSAGVYNVLQPELSQQLKERKIRNLNKVGADIICAGNLGCIHQLSDASSPICHTIQILDWAYGGPKPDSLVERLG